MTDYQAPDSTKKGIPEGHVKLERFLTIPVFAGKKIVAVTGVANKSEEYTHSDIRQLTLLMDNVWKITERMELMESLKTAKEKAEESDRLKTAFLHNMSHEIRTPMNAIMGFSELMLSNLDNATKLENYSHIIKQRSSDLLNIINDILDIAKIESGQLTVEIDSFNLKSLLLELKSIFVVQQKKINKQNIGFNFRIDPDFTESIIETDKLKLKQIFINLISNAFKFTTSGNIEFGCRNENEQLIFYVSDTGIGIPEEKKNIIFERFIQLNAEGTGFNSGNGLGLSIVKGLVSLLDGRIWIESEPGKGSIFYFTIKYTRHTKPVHGISENISGQKKFRFEKKNILIVEDDPYNTILLKEILQNTMANLIHAETGKEAIRKAIELKPDLILLDIGLPDMLGYEAMKMILKKMPDIKIIAQTAYASKDDREKSIKSGCIDYISKPLNPEKLLSVIEKCFR